MNEQLIFCLVFGLQIFCISHYLPLLLQRRATHIFEHYPPQQYPKLYPKPKAEIERALRVFRYLNHGNLCLGAALLLAMVALGPLATAPHANSAWAERLFDDMMPFGYYMVQIAPFIMAEFFGFKLIRLMREQRTTRARSAELKPRKLVDYADPKLCYGALVSFAVFTVAVTALYSPTNQLDKTISFIVILLAGNGFLAAIIFWNLYVAKQDPFASQTDRDHRLGTTINSLLRLSIASSLYCTLIALFDIYFQDQGNAILVSVFLQITMLLSFGSQLAALGLKSAHYEAYR